MSDCTCLFFFECDRKLSVILFSECQLDEFGCQDARLVSLVKDGGSDNTYFTYDDSTGKR